MHQRQEKPDGHHWPTWQEIREEFLISFEDGKSYHMLKRHLTECGLSVEEYKAKWGLPDDYPMVAPYYTRKRADLAKRTQLGQYDRNTAKPRPKKYQRRKAAQPTHEGPFPANGMSLRRRSLSVQPVGAS